MLDCLHRITVLLQERLTRMDQPHRMTEGGESSQKDQGDVTGLQLDSQHSI